MIVYLVGSLGEQGFQAIAATTVRANVPIMVRDRVNAMGLGAKLRTAAATELTRLASEVDKISAGKVIPLTRLWDGPAVLVVNAAEV